VGDFDGHHSRTDTGGGELNGMDRPMGLVSRPFWREAGVLQTKLAGRTTMGWLLLVVLLFVIGWLLLNQQEIITATTADTTALQQERLELQRECQNLQAKLAEAHSIERLMQQAPQLGFYPPGEIPTVRVPRLNPPAGQQELVWVEKPHAELSGWALVISQIEGWIGRIERAYER